MSDDREVTFGDDRLPARFWAKVQRPANDGACWVWVGARVEKGYGQIRVGSGTVKAHRLMLAAKLGRPIGEGLFTCHTCDNPSCVNPAHLWEGTSAENAQDRNRKGRSGAHVHPERMARGETSGRAKLTDDEIRTIRNTAGTLREIATPFGISRSQVSRIRRGEHWRHVTDTAQAA